MPIAYRIPYREGRAYLFYNTLIYISMIAVKKIKSWLCFNVDSNEAIRLAWMESDEEMRKRWVEKILGYKWKEKREAGL